MGLVIFVRNLQCTPALYAANSYVLIAILRTGECALSVQVTLGIFQKKEGSWERTIFCFNQYIIDL
ncbi:MAG: hypothetical protein KAJ51_13505, partial [Thermoplasmata archaeon]|nr:hypothetical protein [Thermoplasmata archaeon]